MGDMRPKIQYQLPLAFMTEGRGETPDADREGTESPTAKREPENPATGESLMEEVCERENLEDAWQQVRSNKGSPGVDGRTIDETRDYLREHWPTIREQLLNGTYRPQPVRRVEIAKPDGGVRKLGIPTVLDRLIQQAVLQVLQGNKELKKQTSSILAWRKRIRITLLHKRQDLDKHFAHYLSWG